MNAVLMSTSPPQCQAGEEGYELGFARSSQGRMDLHKTHSSLNLHIDSYMTSSGTGWFRGGRTGGEEDVF